MWLKNAEVIGKQAPVQIRILMTCEHFSGFLFTAIEMKQFWNDSVNVKLLISCPY